MEAAIGRAGLIDPELCRRTARERFGRERMVAAYFDVYRRLAGVIVIDTEAELQALLPEWDALWGRAGWPPFQSAAWLMPWWAAFGTGRPRVAVLRAGGVLRGLLPMYLLDEGEERKLLPIGVGLTDYCDALIDPAAPPDAASALLRAVLARGGLDGVTSCTLPDLAPGAALLAAELPAGWREVALAQTPCPVLTLPGVVPAGQWRNLRQSRHRAERRGGWSAAVGGDAVALWQALVGMHRARWTALGQPGGVLADRAVLAFHDAAVPLLAEAGVLRMQALWIGGRLAAVYHTLAAPGRLYFYLSGFDAAEGFASPGTLLLGAIVERAVAEGVGELHFLRGGEGYKYAWGAVDRFNESRLLLPVGGGV